MIRQYPALQVNRFERRDMYITISLALYVFSFYLFDSPLTDAVGRVVMYAFLGLSFFEWVTGQKPLKLTAYSVWVIAFGLLGLVSFYYALNGSYVFDALYMLLVSFIITFSFIQYVRKYSYIARIFSFFAYFPIFLVFYLFITGEISTSGQRLGQSLFNNANNLALVMMISLCCVFWLIIYSKRKNLVFNLLLAIVYLYIVALTGGRKFLLIPFIFLFLLLIFQFWQKKEARVLLYLAVFVLIAFASAWAVINIPVLYQMIGVRFEGLLSYLQGDLTNTDYSTIDRSMMIVKGWNWYLQQPLFGYGLNNFQSLLASIWGSRYTVYAHNNYIELMVDLGSIGLVLYYSFYAYLLVKLFMIRNDDSGLRNFFLAFLLVLLMFEVGAVTYNLSLVQIFLGLASAYTRLHDREMKGLRDE